MGQWHVVASSPNEGISAVMAASYRPDSRGVMLVDKRTNKRAFWSAVEASFEPDVEEGVAQGLKAEGDTLIASDGIS